MPKQKTPKLPPNEQFKRFLEAAREKEVDEKAAEKAFKKVSGSKKDDAKQ